MDATTAEQQQSTRHHWEEIYRSIASQYHLYLYQHQLLEILLNLGERFSWGRILEVGCGKGNELIQCSHRGYPSVGIDYSEEALSLLQKRVQEEQVSLLLMRADARTLPLKNRTFDIVFSQGVLEHFRDPGVVLAEQFRVLRAGGYVVVEVPNKWTIYTLYKKILMVFNRWPPGWETQYSPYELKSLLKANGFQIVDCVGWDFFILKLIRKIKKHLGVKEKFENPILRNIRRRLQRNPLLLLFFISITVVGQKLE